MEAVDAVTDAWAKLDSPWKIAVVAIGVLLVLCLLSMLARPQPYSSNLKDLVRQSAQLYETAKQDKDAALALQHVSESLAILSVARHLAADAVIEQATGIKIADLASSISAWQATCVAKLSPRDPTTAALAAGYADL